MLAGGYITADEWTAFVARQVGRVPYVLFDAREGRFRFRQTANHPGPWLMARIGADRAVLDGARWSETWQRSADLVPPRRSRFCRIGHAPVQPLDLSVPQWRVFVASLDGGSVRERAARAVFGRVDVIEALHRLVAAILVRPDHAD